MLDGTLPGYWGVVATSLTSSNATKCKVIVDVAPPLVMPAISGETALPNELTVRQRILQGGQRILDGVIASTDSSARSVILYVGTQLTLYADMGVAATTATVNATITRTAGSFITDGWKVGDRVMLLGAVNDANNGNPVSITAVTATTLTVNGVTAISIAETQGAGFKLIRVAQQNRIAIPANAGNSDTVRSVALIGGSTDGRNDDGIFLGKDDMLIAQMAAAITAGASIDISAHRGLY